ncbi:MAG: hypothetical protein CSA49_03475 [Gammaproteobacteria bacterium]|nr:MAG: hypothetical protein CSA49_03475 [Gammaproteobacteria bacterium]
MKFSLIKQLLVISFCTLILPWTGCQYVQEMETLIRQQQSNTLVTFTKPLAENIKTQAVFKDKTSTNEHTMPFFAPLAFAPAILDGYDNEWVTFTTHPLLSTDSSFSADQNNAHATLKTQLFNQELFLFLDVTDTDIRYYDPTKATLKTHDWIKIITPGKNYFVFTSAPGDVRVFYSAPPFTQLTLAQNIKGSWQENDHGYQVEMSIPLSAAQEGIRVDIKDHRQGKTLTLASTANTGTQPLLSPSAQLTEWIQPFESQQWDLQIVNEQGWPLLSRPPADTISLPLVTRDNLDKLILNRLYRFFLDATLPTKYAQQWPMASTRLSMVNERIDLSRFVGFKNQTFQQWYTLNESNQSILLVIQPIKDANNVLGYVIATQKENALLSFTNTALRRVMNLSLLASMVVVSVLLGYAIWLSLRVRKLKHKAETAISPDGSITPFQPSQAADELGELGRSYAQLLLRVKHYNDYLQSLTHKLAHEIRTPLAIVKSSLEMLATTATENQQDYIQRALQGNQRLGNILNAMSESTQVEQLVQKADFHTLDLNLLLQHLAEAYQQAYPEHHFEFIAKTNQQPVTLSGNPDLLAQMIDKLVDNARDFSRGDSPIQLILDTQAHHALIKIINYGSALPEDMSSQVFDSLISIREKNNQQGTHLGLGLYIVRLITKAHHGTVTAYNLPEGKGEGVCFEIQLPLAAPTR